MAIVEGVKYWADNEPVRGFDANAYLMSQSVMRFNNASDRDSALARSLTSGMIAYNKSTTTLQLYDGTSWIDVATGTLTADHGSLTGLGDDDHPQYLLKSGGTVTGDLTITDSGSDTILTVSNDTNALIRVNDSLGTAGTNLNAKIWFQGSGVNSGVIGYNSTTQGIMLMRNTNGAIQITTDTPDNLQLRTDATTRVTVDGIGRVGIGDTTPAYKLDVNGDGRFVNNLYVTGTTSTMLEVEHSSDSGLAEIRVKGSGQGTGAMFAGQSNTHGGGIFYNGDGTPAYATGESADKVSFFRRNAGTNEVVFYYPYNSNTVDFRGNVNIAGQTIVSGYLQGASVVGASYIGANSTDIYGTAGRNYFKDSEKSSGNGLRVGAAWGKYGIYSEDGDVVIGANTGVVRFGDNNNNTYVASDNFYSTDAYISGIVQANEFRASDYGPASDPSFTFVSDEDTGMYRYTTNQPAIVGGGTWRIIAGQAGGFTVNYQINASGMTYNDGVCGGSANRIAFRWVNPYGKMSIDNVICATAASFSDERIKTDITSWNEGLDMIRQLRPVTYRPRDIIGFGEITGNPIEGVEVRDETLIGLIAQEVAEIIPSAVTGNPEGTELMSILEDQMLAVIISAVQNIDSRVQALEAA